MMNISTTHPMTIFVEFRAVPAGLATDDLVCKIYIKPVVRDM